MSTMVNQSSATPLLGRRNKTTYTTKTLVSLALLTALAYLFMFLSKLLPSVQGFLDFDFKDVAIAMGGFLFGPMAAGLMVVAVSLLEFFTVSHTGLIGLTMNILATGSFCCTASLIYWYRPTFKGSILGLSLGGLIMTALMLLWNYAITPLYMGIPRAAVAEMLVPVFLPFNLVKAGLNMGAVLMVYPAVERALSKAKLVTVESRENAPQKALLISVGVLTLFILLAMVLTGII